MSSHGLIHHAKSPRELVVGNTNEGSASCACGRFKVSLFDNRAGRNETLRQFHRHLVDEGIIRPEKASE